MFQPFSYYFKQLTAVLLTVLPTLEIQFGAPFVIIFVNIPIFWQRSLILLKLIKMFYPQIEINIKMRKIKFDHLACTVPTAMSFGISLILFKYDFLISSLILKQSHVYLWTTTFFSTLLDINLKLSWSWIYAIYIISSCLQQIPLNITVIDCLRWLKSKLYCTYCNKFVFIPSS